MMVNYRTKRNSESKWGYVKIFLFVLSGSIMIGHGARMIYQGLYVTGSTYAPNLFDIFFDWLVLAILGIFILSFALNTFYHKSCEKCTLDKYSYEDDYFNYPT
jgi:hypothetical protein